MENPIESGNNNVNPQSQVDEIVYESLISCVRTKRILYDSTSNSNKNKNAKEAAWMEIAQYLDKLPLWCQVEWGKLKATYYRKKKAIKGKSGQARRKIELWSHFQSMQFLDDYILEASTSGNMEDFDCNLSLDSNFSENSPGSPNIAETVIEAQPVINQDKTSLAQEKVSLDIGKGRKRPMDKVDEEIIKYLKKPEEIADSHRHFCLGLAEQMRNMTKKQASFAKMKITEVMFSVEFGNEDN